MPSSGRERHFRVLHLEESELDLELLEASMREIPFILVSGEIGDDTAVEAMRNGASDYLQKSHLARLVPALLHAIDAAETRRARIRADRDLMASKQRLHELAQHLQTSVEPVSYT